MLGDVWLLREPPGPVLMVAIFPPLAAQTQMRPFSRQPDEISIVQLRVSLEESAPGPSLVARAAQFANIVMRLVITLQLSKPLLIPLGSNFSPIQANQSSHFVGRKRRRRKSGP